MSTNQGSPLQGPRQRTPFIEGHHTEEARAFFESPQKVIAQVVREGVVAANEDMHMQNDARLERIVIKALAANDAHFSKLVKRAVTEASASLYA